MVSEEKQIWHCFGCQKGGDIFGFVMEMEGLEFREALKMLAEKAGVKLQSYNPQKAEEKNRTLEILELATKWYDHQLWKGPGKIKILEYLHKRGLRDETIKNFRLGYAPSGWRNILQFLLKRGYKTEEIARAGLLVKKDGAQDYYDRFRDRVMFPIADFSGKIVGYSARVAPGQDESQAKYINTPETEVYHKSRVLYGLDKARSEIKKNDSVLLVEGNMDVIAASQTGLKNTIAVSGTALTEEQIGFIKRYTKNIKMFFDMDSAGELATKKSVKLSLARDMSVKIVTLPQGKDAADLARENPEELKKAVEGSLAVMDYFFQKTFQKLDKNKIEDKKKISQELLEIIATIENNVEKSHWIKKLSEALIVPEEALTNELKKASLRSRTRENAGSEKPVEAISVHTKWEMLLEELVGLMLVSEIAWKKAKEKEAEIWLITKDKLVSHMLQKAEELSFNFDPLIKSLLSPEDIARAERIFFQKKYRIGLNNELEEIILDNPLADLELCLKSLKQESCKEELQRIADDLKAAENKKDKTAMEFLRQEFNKISKALTELIN